MMEAKHPKKKKSSKKGEEDEENKHQESVPLPTELYESLRLLVHLDSGNRLVITDCVVGSIFNKLCSYYREESIIKQ